MLQALHKTKRRGHPEFLYEQIIVGLSLRVKLTSVTQESRVNRIPSGATSTVGAHHLSGDSCFIRFEQYSSARVVVIFHSSFGQL